MKSILVCAVLAACSGSAWASGFDFDSFQTSPTGSWAEAIAVGDVDGDRLEDVVVATSFYFDEPNDHRVFVYRQRSDGSLAAPVKYKYTENIHKYKIDIALGDLNEDGALDIVTGHHDGLFVLISNGSGGFAGRTLTPPATTQHPACNSVVIRISMPTDTWISSAAGTARRSFMEMDSVASRR